MITKQQKVGKGIIDGTLSVIGSKSLTQRALWAAALSDGTSVIRNASVCDDAIAVANMIKQIGAEVTVDKNSYHVKGISGYKTRKYKDVTIDCKESGFCLRTSLAILSLNGSDFKITGKPSLMRRSIGNEIKCLHNVISYDSTENIYTMINSLKPGDYTIDSPESSQLISGLFYAFPLLEKESRITIKNPVSIPYLNMTINVLKAYNININKLSDTEYNISPLQRYKSIDFSIEGDMSGAAFFAVAGAIAGKIILKNLDRNSWQGDKKIFDVIAESGASIQYTDNNITIETSNLSNFKYDATDTPDLFPPLVALACNCDGVSEIKGVSRLAEKESNRRDALISEFSKLGAEIWYDKDTMYIKKSKLKSGTVESHNDHRIAMAISVAALKAEGDIYINDPDCVNKSYPNYYYILESIKR